MRAYRGVGGCHLWAAYSRKGPQVEGSLLDGPTAPCSTNSHPTAETNITVLYLLVYRSPLSVRVQTPNSRNHIH